MNGELISATIIIVVCFLALLLIVGVAFFVFNKVKLKDKTARQIEIVGYFLLFVVLIWELLFKNIFNGDFYKADSYYLSEKLSVLFRMLESTIKDTDIDVWALRKHFYSLNMGDYLAIQLLTIDVIESILKISSTVFIAVGRFQELKNMKPNDKNQYSVRKLKINELHKLTQLFKYKNVDGMIAESTGDIENGIIDIFALFDNKKIIGELRVKHISDDNSFAVKGKRAYLYAFRIHQNYQGKGLGNFLLENVLERLTENGYSEFTVGVEDDNSKARYMYKKHGFTEPIARIKESYQGDSYEYDLLLKR